MITHIRQLGPKDCGIAVAAMVTGRTYDEVAMLLPLLRRASRGLRPSELKLLLEKITGKAWKLKPRSFLPRRCGGLHPQDENSILVLTERRWGLTCHSVAIEGLHVHDPALAERIRLDQYPKKQWFVAYMLSRKRTCRLLRSISPLLRCLCLGWEE